MTCIFMNQEHPWALGQSEGVQLSGENGQACLSSPT